MTAVHNSHPTIFECHGAWLRAAAHDGATVLEIGGEIDACNADRISEHAHRYVSSRPVLVLDMSPVDFFGVTGLRNLLVFNDECRRLGIDWALIPSRAVCFLLRIADVDAAVPMVESVTAALQRFKSRGPNASDRRNP